MMSRVHLILRIWNCSFNTYFMFLFIDIGMGVHLCQYLVKDIVYQEDLSKTMALNKVIIKWEIENVFFRRLTKYTLFFIRNCKSAEPSKFLKNRPIRVLKIS